MTILELIKAVKEKKLSREQLEDYHDQLSALFAEMQIEMADLEKLEAIFMDKKAPEQSVAEMKVFWKAGRDGQRLIELKRYSIALKEMINSLKSRTFRLIN